MTSTDQKITSFSILSGRKTTAEVAAAESTTLTTQSDSNPMTDLYSIERLENFENYRQKTSLLWMFFVICGSPWLCISVFILFNSLLPLEDPKKGWKMNFMAFVRVFLLTFIGVGFGKLQRKYYLPETKTGSSWRQDLVFFTTREKSCGRPFTPCGFPFSSNF